MALGTHANVATYTLSRLLSRHRGFQPRSFNYCITAAVLYFQVLHTHQAHFSNLAKHPSPTNGFATSAYFPHRFLFRKFERNNLARISRSPGPCQLSYRHMSFAHHRSRLEGQPVVCVGETEDIMSTLSPKIVLSNPVTQDSVLAN